MNNDVAQLRLEIQRLKQENVKLMQGDVKFKLENLRLSQDKLRLSQENLKLSQDNSKLRQNNLRLNQDVSKLCTDNLTLRRQITPMDQRILDLEKEIKDLRSKMELENSLVKVGVAIRLRFLEQAKETRGLGTADDTIIEAGNHAAHRRDICADAALFTLGHMEKSLLIRTSSTQNPQAGGNMKELFNNIYTNPFPPSEGRPKDFSQKAYELFDLGATMRSCSPSFPAPGTSFFAESDRLDKLTRACAEYFLELWEAGIETNEIVEEMLRQIREIVERTVRLRYGRNRGRRT